MKNFIKFFVLFLIVFDFTSCLDDDNKDPNYFFYDEPVIVESAGDTAIVRSAYGKFCVPSLKTEDLQVNDILWSSFVVEKNDENKIHTSGNQYYYKATGFRYAKVDSAKVEIPADANEFQSYLADDYTEKINRAVLYKTYVDSLLFFGFEHTSTAVSYEYELFLNPQTESSNGHPTLYLRAKRRLLTENSYAQYADQTIFAFDMTPFIDYYRKTFPGKNTIQFNLKYYTDTKDDKAVYREFLSNPLSWQLHP
jgi:hypothetical protein